MSGIIMNNHQHQGLFPIPNRDWIPMSHFATVGLEYHQCDSEFVIHIGERLGTVRNSVPGQAPPADGTLFLNCMTTTITHQRSVEGRRIMEAGEYVILDGREQSIPRWMSPSMYYQRYTDLPNDVATPSACFRGFFNVCRHLQRMTMHISLHLLMVVFVNLGFDQILDAVRNGLTAWPYVNYRMTHLGRLVPPRFFQRVNPTSRDSTNTYCFRLPPTHYSVWQRIVRDSENPVVHEWWNMIMRSLFIQEWTDQAQRVDEVNRTVYKVCVAQMDGFHLVYWMLEQDFIQATTNIIGLHLSVNLPICDQDGTVNADVERAVIRLRANRTLVLENPALSMERRDLVQQFLVDVFSDRVF